MYFHQFYCPGQKGEWNHSPRIGGVVDMRLGTWLARDIPHTGMASQIDVTGGIHYFSKTVPGQRLALHAVQPPTTLTAATRTPRASPIPRSSPMVKIR